MLSVELFDVQKLRFNKIEKPIPKNDEVLIKIKTMGVCGSDIHAYHGLHPTIYLPVVQGHEFSGYVEDFGAAVKEFKKGDLVTVRPQYTCGECYHCKSGHENICHDLMVIGCNSNVPGAAQEYVSIKSKVVYKLPPSMSTEAGAMVEPVAVGVAAVRSFRMDVTGKNILVLGAGTIGNLTAQVAKALGAKSVMITDISDDKLAIAKTCGIDHVINSSKVDLNEAVIEAFGKDGLDGILECVGISATVNDAIKVSRKRNEIIIVGIFADHPAIKMIDVQEKELVLIGSLMYLDSDFREAIALIRDKKVNIEPLKTTSFKLKDMVKAYDYIDEHKATAMKVFLNIND